MKLTPEIAALYIGCEVQTKIRVATEKGKPMQKLKGELLEVDLGMKSKLGIHLENEPDKCNYRYLTCADVKLILRPLYSMTESEKEELIRIDLLPDIKLKDIDGLSSGITGSGIYYSYESQGDWRYDSIDCEQPSINQLLWLLQHRFDLFELIADGAAQVKN